MDHAQLTPLGLFLGAGPFVKGIMLVLLAASVWAWVAILDTALAISRLARAVAKAEASGQLSGTLLEPIRMAGDAAFTEVIRAEPGFAKARVEAAMRAKASECVEQAEGALPSLAIIASAAPFVGLLGTVWGIMGSFIGIAAMKDTSLAVVAPGIAEALAATAIGLAAAIPAAVGYNRIGAALARVGRRLSRLIEARAYSLASPQSRQPVE